MFFEYAIEPAVIADAASARFFLDSCRPWKGRFVASYPKSWPEMVLQRATDVERKAIEVRLLAAKNAGTFLRGRRRYEEKETWLWNAEAEHVRSAFRAIIAAEDHGLPHILEASKVDDSHGLWRVDGGRLIDRDHAKLVDAIRLLLLVSSHVAIIDPHFRADQPHKTGPLAAICRGLRTPSVPIEVHWSDEPDSMPSYAQCMRHAERALPDLLPDGVNLSLKCWHGRPGSARIHNRYLLTDVAGVKFGDSIEQGAAGHQDHVSILDEPSRATLWNQYVASPGAFDPGGAVREFRGRRQT
jgi:hypothetical protein